MQIFQVTLQFVPRLVPTSGGGSLAVADRYQLVMESEIVDAGPIRNYDGINSNQKYCIWRSAGRSRGGNRRTIGDGVCLLSAMDRG